MWTLQIQKCYFDKKTYLQSLLLNSGLIGLSSGIQCNCRLHLICRHYEPLSRFIIKTMSQIFQKISSILNFFCCIMVYGFGYHNTNCKSEIKRKAFPPPKCFRRNNYLFNLLEPTRDDYNTHSIIVWKPIIHISMALTRFTLAIVGASSTIHVMEKDLIQI